ncbi:MAG: tRNA (adenosine(37)-N6)-threonylcarbamoyltransferase complex ATPase subunit type 1 TsaE, partial [Clostridia bacterium]|nr:tRNA (adenosine(37)-N6)-threonylcarbamoyltransferase complex ATPase subunit type 1 TsaE [Clostridia bacterium]
TCLTQGIAHGLGIDAVTQSPTFTLIREYEGRLPLYHMDRYRLNFSEISDLGIEESVAAVLEKMGLSAL